MINSRFAAIFGEPGNKFQENLKSLSYFAKNILTNRLRYNIIIKPCRMMRLTYGGIAQLARAFGSYPECRWFESNCRYQFWPGGQEVKTPPFHGGNTSSILVRVTNNKKDVPKGRSFCINNYRGFRTFMRLLTAVCILSR